MGLPYDNEIKNLETLLSDIKKSKEISDTSTVKKYGERVDQAKKSVKKFLKKHISLNQKSKDELYRIVNSIDKELKELLALAMNKTPDTSQNTKKIDKKSSEKTAVNTEKNAQGNTKRKAEPLPSAPSSQQTQEDTKTIEEPETPMVTPGEPDPVASTPAPKSDLQSTETLIPWEPSFSLEPAPDFIEEPKSDSLSPDHLTPLEPLLLSEPAPAQNNSGTALTGNEQQASQAVNASEDVVASELSSIKLSIVALRLKQEGFSKFNKAAHDAAKDLCDDIDSLCGQFTTRAIDKKQFKLKAKEAIKTAHTVLDEHRGYLKNILANLLLAVVTFGVGYGIAALAKWTLFPITTDTDSKIKLDKLKDEVRKLAAS